MRRTVRQSPVEREPTRGLETSAEPERSANKGAAGVDGVEVEDFPTSIASTGIRSNANYGKGPTVPHPCGAFPLPNLTEAKESLAFLVYLIG